MAISEQNPFPQDIEESSSSLRKGWFCNKVMISLCTGLVGVAAILGLLYILIAFMAYDPLGYGHFTFGTSTRSPRLSPSVYFNHTQRSIEDWSMTSTTSLEVTTEFEAEPTVTSTENWSTSDAYTWFTTDPTFSTTMASTVPEPTPTMASTTRTQEPTTFESVTDPSTASDPTSMVPYVQETEAPTPPSWSYRRWPEDEYNRPHYMGRAKWYQCTPKWLSIQDFLDKQWMCQRCEQDAIDGTFKMDAYELEHYDFFCYMMCFINSIFEQCAIHLNQTKPRSSPHSVRDCHFCNDLEEHRITRRN